MRKLLESNLSNMVSLEQETELLTTYMELEDVRFEKKITYSIEIDPRIIPSSVEIPVMLLQPFIENAIWHGLLKKKGERLLKISFLWVEDGYIKCLIDDNGIGRKHARSGNPGKKSLATLFVLQRLDLLNKIHGLNCSLIIEDKAGDQGTRVAYFYPFLKNNHDTKGHHHRRRTKRN